MQDQPGKRSSSKVPCEIGVWLGSFQEEPLPGSEWPAKSQPHVHSPARPQLLPPGYPLYFADDAGNVTNFKAPCSPFESRRRSHKKH